MIAFLKFTFSLRLWRMVARVVGAGFLAFLLIWASVLALVWLGDRPDWLQRLIALSVAVPCALYFLLCLWREWRADG